MSDTQTYPVTVSPQIHEGGSTANIMWSVSICLTPAALWGVFSFGISAFWVLLGSIAASCAAEAVCSAKKITLGDGSAFLTGLLVGMNMPPSVPIYIPIIASVFAIVVVKWTFGGLGANWMNPALAGRVFVFFSWTGPMTVWTSPRAVDTVTTATQLGYVKAGLAAGPAAARGPVEFLVDSGYPVSNFAESASTFLRDTIGLNLSPIYLDGFFGNIPGCIGEVSAVLLLLGAVYLFAKRIITWHIPVSYLAVFSLLAFAFGGGRFGQGGFSGDPLFQLFTGGLILGAFYMATDMTTTPIHPVGMLIYGAGAGLFTFLIRYYGSFPEGVSLAIILMNVFVPLINRYTRIRVFGTQKEKETA